MPAIDLHDLHNFRQHFEAAAKAWFAEKGITLYTSLELDDPDDGLPEEFYSVEFQRGGAVGQKSVVLDGVQTVENVAFDGRLTFRVHTLRPGSQQTEEVIRSKHDERLVEIQVGMIGAIYSIFSKAALPYYKVAPTPAPQEPLHSRAEEYFLDTTELEYQLQFEIADTAWPVG